MSQKLYELAKTDLGLHETLNPDIPPEVGCAQAWSVLAQAAGIAGIPSDGFNTVADVDQFCATHSQFKLITEPELGATIVALSNALHHGHVGIVAKYNLQYPNDWGIISNDSANGTLREQWSYQAWMEHYQIERGLVVRLYALSSR